MTDGHKKRGLLTPVWRQEPLFFTYRYVISWRALMRTASLFRRLAQAVAAKHGYAVSGAEAFVTMWLEAHENGL